MAPKKKSSKSGSKKKPFKRDWALQILRSLRRSRYGIKPNPLIDGLES